MIRRAAFLIIASSLLADVAYAQSPIAVKYCRDLAATYRKAVSPERPADAEISRASVNCPTNPTDSIPTIEAALKKWNVELPPK